MIPALESKLRSGAKKRPDPLENGERMSAPEFLRRYEAMPQIKKAELIEGVVYLGSPVRADVHAAPDNMVQVWLGLYASKTPGLQALANSTLNLDADNAVQPDCLLRISEEHGGTSRIDHDGYLMGAPELVVEITTSSKSIDLHEKLRAYRRNGVKEYLVWRTLEEAFDWFVLEAGIYKPQTPDASGLMRSVTFPGLVLDVTALLQQNSAQVVETLTRAIDCKEHREFVAGLKAAKNQREGKK